MTFELPRCRGRSLFAGSVPPPLAGFTGACLELVSFDELMTYATTTPFDIEMLKICSADLREWGCGTPAGPPTHKPKQFPQAREYDRKTEPSKAVRAKARAKRKKKG